jgi:hypothetical protein
MHRTTIPDIEIGEHVYDKELGYGGNGMTFGPLGAEGFMPFKSQAQRRKFAQLLVEGKISNETFEEWNRATGSTKLPERLGSNSKKAKRTKGPGRPRRAGKKR